MECGVTAVSRVMASTVGHPIASFHFNVDVRSIPLNAVHSGSICPPGRPIAAWVEGFIEALLLIQARNSWGGWGNSVEQREVVYMGLLFSQVLPAG